MSQRNISEINIVEANKCNIPKIIHQMWKDNNVPEHWLESPKEWKRLFPDFAHMFWTDVTMREFMVQHYNWFLPIYDGYKYPIQRSDSFRCFMLHFYGGIYSDLDIVPTSNFTYLFENTNAEVYLPMTQNILSFTNCLMMSQKKARFWETTFKVMKERANKNYWLTHFQIIFSTGPQMLTKSVEIYNQPIGLLPRNIISQNMTNPEIKDNTYTKALYGRSWHRWDSTIITGIYVNRNLIYKGLFMLLIYWIYLFIIYRNYYNQNMS